MSNFTVNGVYTYTSKNIYSYLGRVPVNSAALERAFDDFDITPTGSTDDLKKLNKAMYEEYSAQVQEQIKNQKIIRQIKYRSSNKGKYLNIIYNRYTRAIYEYY